MFSKNGTGTTGLPHTKRLIWTLTLYYTQTLTQDGSKT